MASVTAGFALGSGGWYRNADRSGPYAIDSSGNAFLISTGAAALAVVGTGRVNQGYRLALTGGGYFKETDNSGPYCIDAAGTATLI